MDLFRKVSYKFKTFNCEPTIYIHGYFSDSWIGRLSCKMPTSWVVIFTLSVLNIAYISMLWISTAGRRSDSDVLPSNWPSWAESGQSSAGRHGGLYLSEYKRRWHTRVDWKINCQLWVSVPVIVFIWFTAETSWISVFTAGVFSCATGVGTRLLGFLMKKAVVYYRLKDVYIIWSPLKIIAGKHVILLLTDVKFGFWLLYFCYDLLLYLIPIESSSSLG